MCQVLGVCHLHLFRSVNHQNHYQSASFENTLAKNNAQKYTCFMKTTIAGVQLTDEALFNLEGLARSMEYGEGELAAVVACDVEALRSGRMTRDALLARYVDGVLVLYVQGWREYVDAAATAARRPAAYLLVLLVLALVGCGAPLVESSREVGQPAPRFGVLLERGPQVGEVLIQQSRWAFPMQGRVVAVELVLNPGAGASSAVLEGSAADGGVDMGGGATVQPYVSSLPMLYRVQLEGVEGSGWELGRGVYGTSSGNLGPMAGVWEQANDGL
jgi:hypothetical protein